jgi:hypothetical protein
VRPQAAARSVGDGCQTQTIPGFRRQKPTVNFIPPKTLENRSVAVKPFEVKVLKSAVRFTIPKNGPFLPPVCPNGGPKSLFEALFVQTTSEKVFFAACSAKPRPEKSF